MKIAVTFKDNEVFQHFGHTEQFKIYDIENNHILKSEIITTNGQGHGALAGILKNIHADKLICGGIGGGAKTALEENGIELMAGVTGNCDIAVNNYLNNNLTYDNNANCSHHDSEHGNGDHLCGEHGCGKDCI